MAYEPYNPSRNLNEVAFANHSHEFERFFNNHYKINSEISGFMELTYFEQGIEKKVLIGPTNFWTAIKRVQAFVIDNLHYIDRFDDKKKLLKQAEILEQDFVNNSRYQKLSEKENLTATENLELNYMYIDYLTRCFKLGNVLNSLLQNTIMINTRAAKKSLIFRDEAVFHYNLGKYRDFMALDLANLKLINIIDHYKRLSGYYYSYKVLFLPDETMILDPILAQIERYVVSKDLRDLLIYMYDNNSYSDDMRRKIIQDLLSIKSVMQRFYSEVNTCLSLRNLLPRARPRQTQDFTGI